MSNLTTKQKVEYIKTWIRSWKYWIDSNNNNLASAALKNAASFAYTWNLLSLFPSLISWLPSTIYTKHWEGFEKNLIPLTIFHFMLPSGGDSPTRYFLANTYGFSSIEITLKDLNDGVYTLPDHCTHMYFVKPNTNA